MLSYRQSFPAGVFSSVYPNQSRLPTTEALFLQRRVSTAGLYGRDALYPVLTRDALLPAELSRRSIFKRVSKPIAAAYYRGALLAEAGFYRGPLWPRCPLPGSNPRCSLTGRAFPPEYFQACIQTNRGCLLPRRSSCRDGFLPRASMAEMPSTRFLPAMLSYR